MTRAGIVTGEDKVNPWRNIEESRVRRDVEKT
jgi:hypothetical protein